MSSLSRMTILAAKDTITQDDFNVNTFIKNGYISKAVLKQIKNVCKTASMSQADCVLIATTFDIYDGIDDYSVCTMMLNGFNDVVNNCNRLRGVTPLDKEFMIVAALCGIEEAVNMHNAMGCGAQIVPACNILDVQNQIEFRVETNMPVALNGRGLGGGNYQ